jgi:hypothetical protein
MVHREIRCFDGPILGVADSLIQSGSRSLLAGQVFERFGFVRPLASALRRR